MNNYKETIDRIATSREWYPCLKDLRTFETRCYDAVKPFTNTQTKRMYAYADKVFKRLTGYTEEKAKAVTSQEDARREFNEVRR